MADRELLEALHKQTEAMDRLAKANWLMYMATQKQMEMRTPSNTVFRSYGFGGVNADWRQIVPRNDRRAKITFFAENLSFYFIDDPNLLDINSLINLQNKGLNGNIHTSLITLTGGQPVPMKTTSAIWAASLTGGGSTTELVGTLNWIEEIYSNVSGIPTELANTNPAKAGEVEKLTPGLMDLDGDVHASFTREGVR